MPAEPTLRVLPGESVLNKELVRYVRDCADRLGLRDWTFDLHFGEELAGGIVACCEPWHGRKLATVRFREGFDQIPPEQMRHTVCHELLHVHFFAMAEAVRTEITEWMGAKLAETFWRSTLRDLEHGIDAVAEFMAPHLPLP